MLDEQLGIVVDDSGNLYVADPENSRIQKFSPNIPSTMLAETEIRLELVLTANSQVILRGKTYMRSQSQTLWTEFYGADLEIIVKNPDGIITATIYTQTQGPDISQSSVPTGFDETVLNLQNNPVIGDWNFTVVFNGDVDYLPYSKSTIYTVKDTSSPPSVGSLGIQVTDNTGASIKGAAVSISGQGIYNGVTDETGIYQILNAPLGEYQYSVTKSGYIPQTGTINLSVEEPSISHNVHLLESQPFIGEKASILVTITFGSEPIPNAVVSIDSARAHFLRSCSSKAVI